MKNVFLLLIAPLCITHCFAQDIVAKRNRLSDSVIEKYYVLKSDQKIKQGPYKAYFRRNTIIAAGNYDNGKRHGVWSFCDTKGKLVENYNYNTNSYMFEAPLDTDTDLHFLFDTIFAKTDIVTRPLKVGGSYFGFVPYLSLFQLPFETVDIETDYFNATVELLISPLGRLADYKVHVISPYYDYDHIFNLDTKLFSEEDRTFQPATLNGEPIISRIIIRCFVTPTGGLDFY